MRHPHAYSDLPDCAILRRWEEHFHRRHAEQYPDVEDHKAFVASVKPYLELALADLRGGGLPFEEEEVFKRLLEVSPPAPDG
jgi:hypothetical protein